MTDEAASIMSIGVCEACGKSLRMKPQGLRKNLRMTCKCGHLNLITIEDAILLQYGIIQPAVVVDIFQ
jgi:hypothetical protein